jgi:membrane-bound metal-dependent hydrolase YbcI (DUF457 family)
VDILTHAGIGLIAASPFLADRPELALGIAAGSVLPDLDALSRLVNRRAFLQAHQTSTHALPVQAAVAVLAGGLATYVGWNGVEIGGGLLAGLVGHSLLDLTNTFGVALFVPFSWRRFCLEWVFFIDATVLATMGLTLALVLPIWFGNAEISGAYTAAFFIFLCGYILGKGVLRRRAGRFTPEAKSLAPSALVPWRFFGTRPAPDGMILFRVNALTGVQSPVAKVPVFDEAFAPILDGLPEFRVMREASPEYHVVSALSDGHGTRLLCRDLRIRNFGTRFGDLEVWLDEQRQIIRSRFHA